jgi:hypothetical protein
MFGIVQIMHNNIEYKNFEAYKIHFEKAIRKMIPIFGHLIDFLYLLGLKFVGLIIDNMCKKFSCKKNVKLI